MEGDQSMELQMLDTSELRNELKNFVVFQEKVLRTHDKAKGKASWKGHTAQSLTSRVAEEFGEVVSHLFGQDPVADFLVASLRDHIEECGVSLDYDPASFRRELADVANFCMMLHDIADDIDPRTPTAE